MKLSIQRFNALHDRLFLDKDDILGAGVFGQVVRAKYDGQTVAVKMVKPGAEKSYLKALLAELKIMISIGRHPHISELIGACSKDLRRGTTSNKCKMKHDHKDVFK
jgi:serine/threonine protein kinase